VAQAFSSVTIAKMTIERKICCRSVVRSAGPVDIIPTKASNASMQIVRLASIEITRIPEEVPMERADDS
jgi:hypothetical protein